MLKIQTEHVWGREIKCTYEREPFQFESFFPHFYNYCREILKKISNSIHRPAANLINELGSQRWQSTRENAEARQFGSSAAIASVRLRISGEPKYTDDAVPSTFRPLELRVNLSKQEWAPHQHGEAVDR